MSSVRLPRAARTASFRLAALYALLFTVSVVILGAAVYLSARGAIVTQMAARIDAEIAGLAEEYRAGGLEQLRAAVQTRQRAPASLDYVVETSGGTRLAGDLPSMEPRAGWTELTLKDRQDGRAVPSACASRLPNWATKCGWRWAMTWPVSRS